MSDSGNPSVSYGSDKTPPNTKKTNMVQPVF